MMEPEARRLGKYEILEEIGRGGFATVYKARDTTLDRIVALKILRRELLSDPVFVQRFDAEAKMAAQLEHPNIVRVYEVGEFQGTHYLAMEYVEGQSLAEALEGRGRLTVEQTLHVVQGAAAGLDVAHQKGLIHRDIKPSNILIRKDGVVMLTDFGLAKAVASSFVASLTSTSQIIGTLRYMSPEQAEEQPVDRRADIYSLGVVLYEMLAGRPPFTGTTAIQLIRAHADKPPPPPSQFNRAITPAVESVVLRALAKAPGQRYPSAGLLARALEGAVSRGVAEKPVPESVPKPPPEPPRKPRWGPRRVVLVLLGAVLVSCLCVAGSVLLFRDEIIEISRGTSTPTLGPEDVEGTDASGPTPGLEAEPTMAEPSPVPGETPVSEPTPTLSPADAPAPASADTQPPGEASQAASTPTPTPSNTPVPTEIPTAASSAHPPGDAIPFAREGAPGQFDDAWSWSPGSYSGNSYEVDGSAGTLKLIAGPGSNMSDATTDCPLVKLALAGDFEVQVRTEFAPGTDEYAKTQYAGLGLGSTVEDYTWFRVSREGGHWGQKVVAQQDQAGKSTEVKSAPYSKDTTYLKLKRTGAQISVAYSARGQNWVWMEEDWVFDLPDEVNLLLFVFSTASVGTEATFSDLRVAEPGTVGGTELTGIMPLAAAHDPAALDERWSWKPGGAEASDYTLAGDELTVIVGPRTAMAGGVETAPIVELRTQGDLEARVRLEFSPETGEYGQAQSGGIGIRSSEDENTWIRIEREGGHWGQKVIAHQSQAGSSSSIAQLPYNKPETFLRIRRVGSKISAELSPNGHNWVPLLTDHIFDFPDETRVFLVAFSTGGQGARATFSGMYLTPLTTPETPPGEGTLAFQAAGDASLLSAWWAWYPGASEASDIVVGDELKMITGPGMNMSGTEANAPQVAYPLRGNFDIEIKLAFDPETDEYGRMHTAGLGLRSADDYNTWLRISREGGHWGQKAIVHRNQAGRTDTPAQKEYSGAVIHFRVVRTGSLWSMLISADGTNWQPVLEDYVMGLSDEVDLFLYVASTSSQGASATFGAPVVTSR